VHTADFAIVGGGVVGLTVALEVRRRHPAARIVVLEKEARCGEHASGRNSGVLHAGFYYPADSLKARLCREGNRRLADFAEEHGVPLLRCGKVVVARSEAEHAGLDTLLERGRSAGVDIESIDEDDLRRLEPRARTVGRALHTPATAVIDPRALMERLAAHAAERGIEVLTSRAWRSPRDIDAGYLINAAGVHADSVAREFGFCEHHVVVPFKGVYLYGNQAAPRLRMHVYPVPDLRMPFLGVHFTVTVDGGIKIGPTALLAPWREAYGSLAGGDLFSRFRGDELAGVARAALRLGKQPWLWRSALSEVQQLSRRVLVARAAELVPGVTPRHFDRWGAPGIRAQLMDRRTGALVMDFHYEGDDRSLHVLNAVSPALTCSLPLAELVVDRVEALAR
jgi:L-2-hydroxyglutarate oxidase